MARPRVIKPTMGAWAIEAYNHPMRLMMLRTPAPRGRDVLIRMHGAEVGDWDDLIRRGEWPMDRPFPLALGLAGAGEVIATGDDASRFKPGDRVYVYSYPLYDNGAWAEYMLVPESQTAHAPASLELTHAGGVPIVGLTAHETLADILQVSKGELVLITAAAGGVGHLAVQIANYLGARVVATARAQNLEFVRELGAETAIDYRAGDPVAAIRAQYPTGVDKALNGVPGEAANQYVAALRDGGHIVDLPGTITVDRPSVRIDTDYVVRADAARLTRLASMFDEGRLKLTVRRTFPFEHGKDALETVLHKHVRGKIVLAID
jgi:NADPH:quinone reductase-like Zn-dependent oxidoreductase